MTYVLDASVALTWIFPDQGESPVDPFGHLRLVEGVVPQIFSTEVLNVLVRNERTRRGSDNLLALQLHRLQNLAIGTDDLTFVVLISDTLPIARQQRLSLFDATYLELAIRLSLPIATLDAGLTRAASAYSVPLA